MTKTTTVTVTPVDATSAELISVIALLGGARYAQQVSAAVWIDSAEIAAGAWRRASKRMAADAAPGSRLQVAAQLAEELVTAYEMTSGLDALRPRVLHLRLGIESVVRMD